MSVAPRVPASYIHDPTSRRPTMPATHTRRLSLKAMAVAL